MYRSVSRGQGNGFVVVMGEGPLDAVTTELVESSLHLTPEQRSLIPAAVDRLREKGMVVTDGPTCRLESVEVGERLHLRLSERSYFDSVLLRAHPHWGLESRALAVACVTLCRDGYLIEKRSQKVASLPGYLHPLPAGNLEPPADPVRTVLAEANEELGLEPSELGELLCLGLIHARLSGVFQLVVRCQVDLDFEDIVGRTCSGRWERDALTVVPATQEGLSAWLDKNRTLTTDAGYAALLLEAGHRWGASVIEERLL